MIGALRAEKTSKNSKNMADLKNAISKLLFGLFLSPQYTNHFPVFCILSGILRYNFKVPPKGSLEKLENHLFSHLSKVIIKVSELGLIVFAIGIEIIFIFCQFWPTLSVHRQSLSVEYWLTCFEAGCKNSFSINKRLKESFDYFDYFIHFWLIL